MDRGDPPSLRYGATGQEEEEEEEEEEDLLSLLLHSLSLSPKVCTFARLRA
jgi:hypothetical protein